uniref:Uncharacterized protein n=1 Tax=Chromera velia CCMP2878 TaxID=1169474 RepID=A0A0G4G896_9ALVE|eukprot:Cvel_4334.t1-p1 / transcript=Cvel_4334.t1 / gene=Cvel_4334 / organism=Chromera_velia_CCMP2878 / gene_product=hypothetical protein / transcript_product=hypothetical protein / location=Cvel_scaffold188:12565-18566(-) / protein_length=1150 / sequence_SO=supercontig / SO=protein_coding / is_pseudo=false
MTAKALTSIRRALLVCEEAIAEHNEQVEIEAAQYRRVQKMAVHSRTKEVAGKRHAFVRAADHLTHLTSRQGAGHREEGGPRPLPSHLRVVHVAREAPCNPDNGPVFLITWAKTRLAYSAILSRRKKHMDAFVQSRLALGQLTELLVDVCQAVVDRGGDEFSLFSNSNMQGGGMTQGKNTKSAPSLPQITKLPLPLPEPAAFNVSLNPASSNKRPPSRDTPSGTAADSASPAKTRRASLVASQHRERRMSAMRQSIVEAVEQSPGGPALGEAFKQFLVTQTEKDKEAEEALKEIALDDDSEEDEQQKGPAVLRRQSMGVVGPAHAHSLAQTRRRSSVVSNGGSPPKQGGRRRSSCLSLMSAHLMDLDGQGSQGPAGGTQRRQSIAEHMVKVYAPEDEERDQRIAKKTGRAPLMASSVIGEAWNLPASKDTNKRKQAKIVQWALRRARVGREEKKDEGGIQNWLGIGSVTQSLRRALESELDARLVEEAAVSIALACRCCAAEMEILKGSGDKRHLEIYHAGLRLTSHILSDSHPAVVGLATSFYCAFKRKEQVMLGNFPAGSSSSSSQSRPHTVAAPPKAKTDKKAGSKEGQAEGSQTWRSDGKPEHKKEKTKRPRSAPAPLLVSAHTSRDVLVVSSEEAVKGKNGKEEIPILYPPTSRACVACSLYSHIAESEEGALVTLARSTKPGSQLVVPDRSNVHWLLKTKMSQPLERQHNTEFLRRSGAMLPPPVPHFRPPPVLPPLCPGRNCTRRDRWLQAAVAGDAFETRRAAERHQSLLLQALQQGDAVTSKQKETEKDAEDGDLDGTGEWEVGANSKSLLEIKLDDDESGEEGQVLASASAVTASKSLPSKKANRPSNGAPTSASARAAKQRQQRKASIAMGAIPSGPPVGRFQVNMDPYNLGLEGVISRDDTRRHRETKGKRRPGAFDVEEALPAWKLDKERLYTDGGSRGREEFCHCLGYSMANPFPRRVQGRYLTAPECAEVSANENLTNDFNQMFGSKHRAQIMYRYHFFSPMTALIREAGNSLRYTHKKLDEIENPPPPTPEPVVVLPRKESMDLIQGIKSAVGMAKKNEARVARPPSRPGSRGQSRPPSRGSRPASRDRIAEERKRRTPPKDMDPPQNSQPPAASNSAPSGKGGHRGSVAFANQS